MHGGGQSVPKISMQEVQNPGVNSHKHTDSESVFSSLHRHLFMLQYQKANLSLFHENRIIVPIRQF